jgi:CcmD family protein
MIIKKIILSIFAVLVPLMIMAQQAAESEVDMADTMRSNGKIYVVVAVVTIIMTGLIVYLVSLDRKITKLEKRISSKNQS